MQNGLLDWKQRIESVQPITSLDIEPMRWQNPVSRAAAAAIHFYIRAATAAAATTTTTTTAVTSGSHIGHAQWYILYYYYSKKKAREALARAQNTSVTDVTSGQGLFRWCHFRWCYFLRMCTRSLPVAPLEHSLKYDFVRADLLLISA
jgi:hypothetical protein